MKDMTIIELRSEKERLEQDLLLLLREFNAKTGINVNKIESVVQWMGYGYPVLSKVSITLDL